MQRLSALLLVNRKFLKTFPTIIKKKKKLSKLFKLIDLVLDFYKERMP